MKKPLRGSGNPLAATGEALCGDSGAGLPRMLVFNGREGPWSVARNGGKMAEAQEALGVEKASSTTNGTTKNKTRRPAGRRAPRKSGTEKLRQEADKRVGWNSKKLADLLTNEALKGDLAYTKALVGFAEGKKPEPVKKRRGLTQAERLAREPQWQGKELGDEEDRD